MASLANTDITCTILARSWYGKQRQNLVKLVFGDGALTYPSGGVAFPSAASLGLKSPLKFLQVLDDTGSLAASWMPDYANSKLRGYGNSFVPGIIHSEAVTLTSNAGTLAYPPAYIIMAEGTISAAIKPLLVVPHTATPATNQITVNWTTGAVLCLSSDSVSALKITYIPQQSSGFFSLNNMVINEVVTLASAGVNLANRAALISTVYQTAATAAAQTFSHAAGSANLCIVDIVNSTATTLTSTSNDGKAATCTYLKYSGLPNPNAVFIDQASQSLTSQVYTWGLTTTAKGSMMIPGFGNQMVNLETTNYTQSKLGTGVTAANLIGKYDMMAQTITTAQTSASTSLPENWYVNYDYRYFPQRSLGEFTINDAPLSTTLYVMAYA